MTFFRSPDACGDLFCAGSLPLDNGGLKEDNGKTSFAVGGVRTRSCSTGTARSALISMESMSLRVRGASSLSESGASPFSTGTARSALISMESISLGDLPPPSLSPSLVPTDLPGLGIYEKEPGTLPATSSILSPEKSSSPQTTTMLPSASSCCS